MNRSLARCVSPLLGLGLWLAFGASALAGTYDATAGVPVRLWASGYGQAVPGPTAQLQLTGNDFLDASGTGLVSLTLNGSTTSASLVSFDTTVGTAHMEPGKVYYITVSSAFAGGNVPWIALQGAPPLGYTLEIDGVERLRSQLNTTSRTFTVRLLGSHEEAFMAAGSSSQLMLGRIYWQVGLGGLRNGKAAGSISIVDPGATANWSALYTPSSLQYERPSDEIIVIRTAGGVLRQVVANQAVVDIMPVSSTAYDISYYHPAQAVGTDPAVPRTFSGGQPYLNYRVEQGATSTTLKITATTRDTTAANGWTAAVVRTSVSSLARTGSALTNFVWNRQDWNTASAGQLSEQVTAAGGTTTDRTDTVATRVPGSGTNAGYAARTYHQFSWGEEITSSTAGSANTAQTAYDYYDNPVELGRHGFVKSMVSPGGGWESYDYWDATSTIGTPKMGTVKYRYRPFTSAPATLGFNTTQGEVTSYTYATDPFGTATRPSLVETRVNGILTASSATTYADVTSASYNGAWLVQAIRNDSVSSGSTLTTTTRFYREDTGNFLLRGQVHSVVRPDNVQVSYAYQRGDLSGTTFTPNTSGLASRIATITGVVGTSYSVYDSYNIDGLTLIEGKSTLETVIRDSRALVVRTESYAWVGGAWQLVGWVNLGYNTMGSLTSRVASNGATYQAYYKGNQKDYEIDESGIRMDYVYDDAGRLWKVQKRNADNTGFTTTVLYAYDAAGRVTNETVNGTGTAEAVANSRAYDDAGRLDHENPAGLGQINHSYNVANRSHTVTTTADGASRTETYLIDGRLDKIEGNATVATYSTYSVDSATGQRITRTDIGAATSSRYTKTWTDWLGRAIKSEAPGFSKSGQAVAVTQNFYDDATVGMGRLFKTTRTGYSAPTLYVYDALGSVIRSGLDVDLSGTLDNNSTDRITESDAYVENYSGQYWLRADSRTYFPGESTPRTTSISRQLLTGLPTNRLSETRSWAVEDIGATGATVVNTVDVNRSTKTVTTTTTSAGLPNSAIAVAVNGLSVSYTSADLLTATSEYDGLERLWRVLAPRQGATGGTGTKTVYRYKSGTSMVESVIDPAGNTNAFTVYDNLGRPTLVSNAEGKNSRFEYNPRGQLLHQWGDATYPVEYGYDATFGQRTAMSTFRGGAAADTTSWSAVGPADTTSWDYDSATGLLWRKTDAATNVVEFDYNVRGQASTRLWARFLPSNLTQRVKTSYVYSDVTGDLTNITYNDGAEVIPTPNLTYAYDRLGRAASVDEQASLGGVGLRTFNYDPTNPWRLLNEALPAFFGSLVISRLYEGSTVANSGTLGSFTTGTQKGRSVGFDLGVAGAGTTARDLHTSWTHSNQLRFAAVTASVSGGTGVDFVYAYKANSGLIDGYTRGNFNVSRDYDANRDLVTRLESKYGTGPTSTVARFDYTHDRLGQRLSVMQSGAAFAAYTSGQSYGAVYHRYAYNARNELASDRTYGGNDVTLTANELPGRRLEYRYDSIGNRKSAGATGSSEGTMDDSGSGDEDYTTNSLNQYVAKENNSVTVTGAVANNANVAILGTMSTSRVDNAWANSVVPANTGGPAIGQVSAFAAVPAAGSPIKQSSSLWLQPKRQQTFVYDADGNLTADGLWTYTYNAENLLVRMTSLLPGGFGSTLSYVRKRIDFKYDYAGRRIEKRLNDMDLLSEISARRFVYDGWNLVAELDGNGAAIQRSYVWGLDLTGDLTKAGGVGALLQLTNYSGGTPGVSYYPAYDGNGNVTALVNAATGGLAASYEYDPFGNPIRNEVIDPAVADNPFRFSTKYTDTETGLVYYGHRFYSPTLGRFLNQDPIAEAGGMNMYGFCGNNGVNRWDLLGNISQDYYRYNQVSDENFLSYGSPFDDGHVSVTTGSAFYTNPGSTGTVAQATANMAVNNINRPANSTYNVTYHQNSGVTTGSVAGQTVSFSDQNGNAATIDQTTAHWEFSSGVAPTVPASALGNGALGLYSVHRDPDSRTIKVTPTNSVTTTTGFVNGVTGELQDHAGLGFQHFKSDSDFTLFNIPTGGFLSDVANASLQKLGIDTAASTALAGVLQSVTNSGGHVDWVAHSGGGAAFAQAINYAMANGSSDLSGNSVRFDAGANNRIVTNGIAHGAGMQTPQYYYSPWDFVPNVVGLNGNPGSMAVSTVVLPTLFVGPPLSTHTAPTPTWSMH